MFSSDPKPFARCGWGDGPGVCHNAPRSYRSLGEPSLAHWLETIRRLPPVRAHKVAAMRRLLASGRYDLPAALEMATYELWRELSASDYELN
jgi:hypothetical protein